MDHALEEDVIFIYQINAILILMVLFFLLPMDKMSLLSKRT
jgi:hypothetical protein